MDSPDSDQPLRFRPRIVPALLALAGIAILLSLGFWQLRRLREKERLMAVAVERVGLPPVNLAEAMSRPEAFAWRRVRVSGAYVPGETVFVFERHTAHAASGGSPPEFAGDGYRVVTPLRADGLRPEGGQPAAILVDRGWIPSGDQRDFLSKDPRRGRVEVIGSLLPLEDEPAPRRSNRKHRLFFAFKLSALRAQVPFPLVPALIRRGDAPDGDLPRGEWAAPRMTVDHRQYAWTWFSLAAVLAVTFVAGSRRRGP